MTSFRHTIQFHKRCTTNSIADGITNLWFLERSLAVGVSRWEHIAIAVATLFRMSSYRCSCAFCLKSTQNSSRADGKRRWRKEKRSKRTRLENLKILNFFTEYSVNSCLLCMTALVPMNMVIFPAELPHWTPCCRIILAITTETSVTFPKSAS